MPTKQTRLQTIAADAMKTWIQRQILEIAQPPSAKSCDDQTGCVVKNAFDWRRDYIAMLTLALNFKTAKDYSVALTEMRARHKTQDEAREKSFADMFRAHSREEFNENAADYLNPHILQCQIIDLEKIERVFSYLNGTIANQDDLKHINPDGKNWMTGSLFTILNDQGTFDEWQDLIKKLPKKRNALYSNHWNTFNPS